MFIESDVLELKSTITPDLKKEIVSFANTKGGIVYIGIDDNGTVCGVEGIPERICEQISSMLHDGIKPDIFMFTSISLENIDHKVVIKVTVQRGTRRPYYLTDKGMKPSGVYVRLGNTSVPATETSIRNMITETDGTNFEDSRSMVQDLTFEVAEREFAEQNIPFGEVQMKTLNIMDHDGVYTNLGLLLSDQCQHSIKVAVFGGKEKDEFVTRKEFDGSLFKQMEEVFNFISLNNHNKATFEGIRRIDSRDYAEEAIREALLNATIHRDYSFSGSTLISIFTDRIEFVSLGGLVSGLEIEDIFTGISQTRNPKLSNIFYRLKFIEAYGTGIRKIQMSCKENNVRPIFEATNAVFKVSIPNRNYGDFVKETSVPIPMENITTCILEYIRKTEIVNRKSIQDKFGLKQTKCGIILKQLEQEGHIKKLGQGKNTVYVFLK